MTEIIGTCTGITEKPTGWVDLEITVPEKQYPVRLSTREEGLITAVRALAGALGRFSYTERESDKINPNSHKPYMNRYLDHVEPADANGTAAATVRGSDPMSKEEWARKDSAAHRRACIAIAVSALQHTMPSDPSEEDLAKFLGRVSALSLAWHRVVLAERDDPAGEHVPF